VSDSTHAERRRHARWVVGVPLTAVRRGAGPGAVDRVVGLHALDLSAGGARVRAARRLERAEVLTLFFPPMGAAGWAEDVRGRVVWCRPCGGAWAAGLAFERPRIFENPPDLAGPGAK